MQAAWHIETTQGFARWFRSLPLQERERMSDAVEQLRQHGPTLGRPHVDTLRHTGVANLKELRAGTLRALFAFDPRRHAVLLVGGDKAGQWERWYRRAVPEAEQLWQQHLDALDREAGNA